MLALLFLLILIIVGVMVFKTGIEMAKMGIVITCLGLIALWVLLATM